MMMLVMLVWFLRKGERKVLVNGFVREEGLLCARNRNKDGKGCRGER